MARPLTPPPNGTAIKKKNETSLNGFPYATDNIPYNSRSLKYHVHIYPITLISFLLLRKKIKVRIGIVYKTIFDQP